MKNHYNWDEIRDRAASTPANTWKGLSEALGIPISTLRDNIDLQSKEKVTRKEVSSQQVEYKNEVVEVTDEGEFPKTPEALCKAVGIDLTQYNIRSFDCFAREVQVKDVQKDLEFDAGKITGTIHDTGDMKIKTIWSSRLVLEPLEIKPRAFYLQTVEVKLPRFTPPPQMVRTSPTITALIPDIHFGFSGAKSFHDDKALDQVLNRLSQVKGLDRVVFLGDLLDFAEFASKFLPSPDQVRTTQRSLNACAKFLGQVRQVAPYASIAWLEGNHEFRLVSQLRANLMALAGLKVAGTETEAITIPYFLNLDSLGIHYVPGWPNNSVDADDVEIMHGSLVGSKPGQTAMKVLDKYNRSIIFGHIHRREYLETTIWSDKSWKYKTIFAYSPGCLCRIDGTVPGSSASQGWTQGIGFLINDGESSWIRDLPYRDGRFLE